jgi:hypothetical protein
LGALLDEFAATDVAALPDAAVRGEVSALLTAAHRLDAVLAARLVSFDQRGLAEVDGFRTARAWLRGAGRLSGPAAAVVLSLGMELRLQIAPATIDLLRERDITFHSAQTLDAVDLYNALADTGGVGGLFHSTC